MTVLTHLSDADVAGYTSDERFLLISLWIFDAHMRGVSWQHITRATGVSHARMRNVLRTLRSMPELPFEVQRREMQRRINRFAADFGLPMRVKRSYTDLYELKSRRKHAWILWGKASDGRLRRLCSTIVEPVA